MYSGQIFGESIKDFSYRNAISVLSNVVLLISCVASSFFVNKIGRKAIFIYGSALCACFLFTLSYLSANQIEGTEFLSVTFIFMYYLAFNFSLGPIVWIYNSEILPAKGISIATLANWYGGTVVTLVLPYFSVFWPLFLIFGIVCIGCVIFSMMCVKETLGKNKL